ncbi:MAG TPA: hypothetical protein VGR96_04580 [Acidobacteriaceae bacterium]|nr:hypothetical protein [Acidobacteriaceae bacterium]
MDDGGLMEADWSVELGAEDPVIVVPWQGVEEASRLPMESPAGTGVRFVDLREDPEAIEQIEEARREPSLRSALLALNEAGSPLWTAKCGLWTRSHQEGIEAGLDAAVDFREMEAEPEEASFAAGCYIDLLPRDAKANASFALQERWIRGMAEQVRGAAMRCARADFVLRHAEVCGVPGFAVTWFMEACGATRELAACRMAQALELTLPLVMEAASRPAAENATIGEHSGE